MVMCTLSVCTRRLPPVFKPRGIPGFFSVSCCMDFTRCPSVLFVCLGIYDVWIFFSFRHHFFSFFSPITAWKWKTVMLQVFHGDARSYSSASAFVYDC